MSLTSEQQLAANSTSKYTLTLAVAGSGKTRLLLERYRIMVEDRKIHPGEIAIITFTRKAGRELRERIEAAGYPQAAFVGTLHALAYDILRKYIDPESIIIGQEEKITRPGTIKAGEGLIFRSSGYLATHPGVLPIRHLLWDEVQDTSSADKDFLVSLNPESVFAAGDPMQQIYDFIGKTGEVIRYLADRSRSKDLSTFTLTQNFRNPLCVVELASALMGYFDFKLDMRTDREEEYACRIEEQQYLLRSIIEFTNMHPEDSVLVLAATNRRANWIAGKLHSQSVTVPSDKILSELFNWSRIALATDKQIAQHQWLAWGVETLMSGVTWRELRAAGTVADVAKSTLMDIEGIPMDLTPAEYQEWYLDRGWLDSPNSKLSVMTMHASKGKEFDHVLFADRNGFTWLSDEEKRKIYYVGATRARKSLTIVEPTWPYLRGLL